MASYAVMIHGMPLDVTPAELAAHLDPFAAAPILALDTTAGTAGGRADGVARVWIARHERQV